jgi:crotonobetainyl-CoA:carnitine CoA-transferase CaiB-like acyl-CoA transferase
MEQALAGFRILDFGHYIPGPYTAMLLADQGADVIKVERPSGDPYRKEPGFMVLNRSKQGITLDLKNTRGQHIAQELARHADVIIENFSPGTADSLGIGFDMIHRINPRAVYLSISGFGRKGPYRNRPGWDAIVGSTAGVYVTQAGGEEYQPLYLVLPLPSYYAAFMSAFSVTMALIARETTGKGQRIDISLFSSIMAAGSYFLVDFEDKIRVPGPVNPQGGQPIYKLYQGSDGKRFFLG